MTRFARLFHRYILRDLARNPIRTVLTLTGVALGIAVVVGVHVANDRAISSFNNSLRILSGQADLQISANGLQLDEELIGELSWVWDVGAMTAIVEGRVDLDASPSSSAWASCCSSPGDATPPRRTMRASTSGPTSSSAPGSTTPTARGVTPSRVTPSTALICEAGSTAERGRTSS